MKDLVCVVADKQIAATLEELLLCLYRQHLVVLHGFIKKTRTTPDSDLATARTRQRELER